MGRIRLTGATSGYTELRAASTAGNNTITLPTTNGGEVIVSDSSGNVNIDSGTLYIDAANNRVGVGTATPGAALDIVGGNAGDLNNPAVFIQNNKFLTLRQTSGNWGMGFYVDSSNNSYTLGLNNLIFGTGSSATERFRCDSSGRLLVGTSSTSQASSIVVQGNSSSSADESVIRMANGSSTPGVGAYLGNLIFTDSGHQTSAFIGAMRDGGTWSASSKPTRLVFSTTADGASSPTERMRIASDGSVLQYGNGNGLTAASAQSAGTTFTTFRGKHSASSTTTGTDSFLVYTNGNVQNTNNSYTAISDIKLKENIADAGSQWDDLKALRVRNYNLKEGQTHKQIGLIAQEVEPISPGLVYETPDRDAEGNDLGTTTKAVQYSVLYMKAVKALQEAMERIEVLEQRLADAGIA